MLLKISCKCFSPLLTNFAHFLLPVDTQIISLTKECKLNFSKILSLKIFSNLTLSVLGCT